MMLSSCDTATFATITNQKKELYVLNIYYNTDSEIVKDYIDQYKNFENFSKFIIKYNNSKFKKDIISDSIEKSVSIKINPKDTFIIWGGLHQSKDFNEIEKIEIINSSKQITPIIGSEISTVFEAKKGNSYLYTIK